LELELFVHGYSLGHPSQDFIVGYSEHWMWFTRLSLCSWSGYWHGLFSNSSKESWRVWWFPSNK